MERFGLKLPDSLTSKFEKDSKHPVYELEIFPILLALRVWQRHFLNAQIVFYLVNDAARSRMIRAEGSTRLTQSLISEFVKLEKQLRVFLGSPGFLLPATQQMMPRGLTSTPHGWLEYPGLN